MLVVLFPDFILIGGASDGISDRAIAMIGERWPDKPIRYVVPTHHHWDHSAGLRSFIARGVTVIVTPGNRALVEQTTAAPFLIRPDALARSPRPSKIETIEGKRKTIAAGNQRVEIYDIGPTPHAGEMVILHVPAAELIFQGDLLELDGDEPIDALTGNEVTVVFLQRLEALALPVKTIVGAEGRVGTMDDLRKAVTVRDSKYD